MKATELRIGNYYDNNGVVNTVSPNTIEEVWVSERSWVKPIPLTEEWLLKFGFEKVVYESEETGYGTDYELEIDGVGFLSYSDDFSCALFSSKRNQKREFGVLPNFNTIKTVHGLQNLYFALTGEGLTL